MACSTLWFSGELYYSTDKISPQKVVSIFIGEVCFFEAAKDRSCFLIQSISLCLFTGELRPLIVRLAIERCILILVILLIFFGVFSDLFDLAIWTLKVHSFIFNEMLIIFTWTFRYIRLLLWHFVTVCYSNSLQTLFPTLSLELLHSAVHM